MSLLALNVFGFSPHQVDWVWAQESPEEEIEEIEFEEMDIPEEIAGEAGQSDQFRADVWKKEAEKNKGYIAKI